MTSRESEKAARYIEQLTLARLNGDWSSIGELVRKVSKHAPQRQCLVLAARAEAQLDSDTATRSGAPGAASSQSLVTLKEELMRALDTASACPDADKLAAEVTLVQIQYLQEQWQDAIQHASGARLRALDRVGSKSAPILILSLLKANCLVGASYEKTGDDQQALRIWQSAVAITSSDKAGNVEHKQLNRWSSRILSRIVSLSAKGLQQASLESMNSDLLRYRAWLDVHRRTSQTSTSDPSPVRTFEAYYSLLSDVLRSNLAYTLLDNPPLAIRKSTAHLASSRKTQYQELREVERAYENYLFNSTSFPKATESNKQYELFVNQILANWRFIQRSEWTDPDIGDGGKTVYSRNVLELLYRAASKTFHSTPVLRHLFTVHASLSEFNLAVKAFDSYTAIIAKGKARAEKTGNPEVGLDTDETVLLTASEAIDMLCTYGERQQAEKAFEIGETIAAWLPQPGNLNTGFVMERDHKPASNNSGSASISAAYRAIGQSQAVWAHYTYDPKERGELHIEATKSFQRSLEISLLGHEDSQSAHLLASVLFEQRRLAQALQVLKKALDHDAIKDVPPTTSEPTLLDFETRRKRLPLLHLLVLVLSARGDFDDAIAFCETAFEDIVDVSHALDQVEGGATPSHYSSADGLLQLPLSMIQRLSLIDKECLIQLKMTEIELLVLLEDISYAAVKRTELIRIYEQLFGNPRPKPAAPPANGQTIVSVRQQKPSTTRSFRQSMFGKPKQTRQSLATDTFTLPNGITASQSHGQNNNSLPVLLTVTNEHGDEVEHDHKGKLSRLSRSIRRGRDRHSQIVPTSTANLSDSEKDHTHTRQATEQGNVLDTDARRHPAADIEKNDADQGAATELSGSTGMQAVSAGVPGEKAVEDELRMTQAADLEHSTPAPALSSSQQQTHRLSVLIQIWLFVSDMYRREDLYDDAEAAALEASELIDALKLEVAKIESSARAWTTRGWGLGKSINRCVGDLWAVRGRLHQSISEPHKAIEAYERSLNFYPDHPVSIVNLSNLLLDIYEEKLPAEAPPPANPDAAGPTRRPSAFPAATAAAAAPKPAPPPAPEPAAATAAKPAAPTPAELDRTACRDRACALLSILTKLGEGWDDAEAWFALARAHELMGVVAKAEECLWWVVELEDSRPVRPWRAGGFGV